MKNVVDYMLCIVYTTRRTAGKVSAISTPFKTMKISIILTSYRTLSGTPLDKPKSSVYCSYPSFASARLMMHDIMTKYNSLGYQVFPFLAGFSVFSDGNPVVSFKFADYKD